MKFVCRKPAAGRSGSWATDWFHCCNKPFTRDVLDRPQPRDLRFADGNDKLVEALGRLSADDWEAFQKLRRRILELCERNDSSALVNVRREVRQSDFSLVIQSFLLSLASST